MQQLALEIVNRLHNAGHAALFAGGCVRDMFLGQQPHDYDVATDASPDIVQSLFRRSLAVGAQFGVIEVLGKQPGVHVQVATFRSDGHYSDGRHPDSVKYGTAEEDAKRRDFTINGLFFDPIAHQFIDYVGGREDLEKKIVRAIGDPYQRIQEDKLRMLRAVRFVGRLGFQLEQATAEAIRSLHQEIKQVSVERITDELKKMLLHRTRAASIASLTELQLLPVLFPQFKHYDSLYPLLQALPESCSFTLAWAALLLDLHRKNDTETWPTRHELMQRYGRAFRLSLEEIQCVIYLVESLPLLFKAEELPWASLKPILAHKQRDDLLSLLRTAGIAWQWDATSYRYCEERLRVWSDETLEPDVLITGEDIAALGIPQGPVYKMLLGTVRDAQLNEEIHDRPEALALLQQLAGRIKG
ncbi:MAG TPA: CCA tRNA nucleotidyltransferase [Gemmatales bacterium]|nr:CCA tRNA nucleotidyltransferase [Gemmatales bacterium]